MEDYTYHLGPGRPTVLGAHMLEVCPSIAAGTTVVRDPPAVDRRQGGSGAARVHRRARARRVIVALIDLGDRFRLVANEVDVVEPPEPLPRLPVARAVWKPRPDFATAAEAWLEAGGSHHTVLTTAVAPEALEDLAEIAGIELLVIDGATRGPRVRQRAALEPGLLPPRRKGSEPGGTSVHLELRERVLEANLAIVEAGLVDAHLRQRERRRPRAPASWRSSRAACPTSELDPESIVLVDLASGAVVGGDLRPSSDAPTHLVLYRRFETIGGIVHTHSAPRPPGRRPDASSPATGRRTRTTSTARCRSRAR